MIVCEVCHKEYKRITKAHVMKHGIENESEYLKIYPNARLYDESYIKNLSEGTKIGMRKPEN